MIAGGRVVDDSAGVVQADRGERDEVVVVVVAIPAFAVGTAVAAVDHRPPTTPPPATLEDEVVRCCSIAATPVFHDEVVGFPVRLATIPLRMPSTIPPAVAIDEVVVDDDAALLLRRSSIPLFATAANARPPSSPRSAVFISSHFRD